MNYKKYVHNESEKQSSILKRISKYNGRDNVVDDKNATAALVFQSCAMLSICSVIINN